MDWERVSKELGKKLHPNAVKPPKKFGPKGEYIESWYAISEANRIFGFGGWCSENVRLECVSEKPRKIGKGEKDGWGVTYICIRQITVGGVVRQGTGAGHGYNEDLGSAHEDAIKEAESDAEKRALRTFGNPFGLALYDKDKKNVGIDAPELTPRQKADFIIKSYREAETVKRLTDINESDKIKKALDGFPEPLKMEVNAAYNEEYNRLTPIDEGRAAQTADQIGGAYQ